MSRRYAASRVIEVRPVDEAAGRPGPGRVAGDAGAHATRVATEPIFLTPGEVAAILRVHPRTVLRLAQQDATMPATRLGTKLVRFEKAALDRWLARKRPRLAQRSTQASHRAG